MILLYLGSCIGFYCAMATVNYNTYKNATKISIVRGIIGALVWPVIIPLIALDRIDS